MTKIIKFWMRFSFWNKVRGILTALGAGGELALYLGDSHNGVAAVVAILLIVITYFVEDKNNNDIVDILE